MQQIKDLTSKALRQPNEIPYTDKSTATSRPMMEQRWIAAIFEKLRRRYGTQWTTKVGIDRDEIKESMQTWAEILVDLKPEEIAHGFERLDDKAPEFPPSVMQFKQLCRIEKSIEAHRHYKALPRPKANMGIAQKHIQKMREALRGK